jgi:hypothetical protein
MRKRPFFAAPARENRLKSSFGSRLLPGEFLARRALDLVALQAVLVALVALLAGLAPDDPGPELVILAKKTSYIIRESMKRGKNSAFKPIGGSL